MNNIIKNPKTKIFIQWALLALVVGILLAAVYVFAWNLETLRRGGFFRGHIRRQPVAQRLSPDQIRGWMTFRYVNLVFNLPPGYLQSELNIKNGGYPNISLDSLAKGQSFTSAELIAKISAAVKNFGGVTHP
jgi:hypothetical protein